MLTTSSYFLKYSGRVLVLTVKSRISTVSTSNYIANSSCIRMSKFRATRTAHMLTMSIRTKIVAVSYFDILILVPRSWSSGLSHAATMMRWGSGSWPNIGSSCVTLKSWLGSRTSSSGAASAGLRALIWSYKFVNIDRDALLSIS